MRHFQEMTIVNIGANDGMDDCRDFVLANREKVRRVLLVEPSEEALEKCKKNYSDIPNAEFFNLAIVPGDSNFAILYSPKDEPQSHHSSLIPDHTLFHGYRKIEGIIRKAMGIEAFLKTNNAQGCDRLYIDAEGMDFHILSAIDFSKHKIGFIRYESYHFDGVTNKGQNHELFVQRLVGLGYSVRPDGQWNEIAEKSWNI